MHHAHLRLPTPKGLRWLKLETRQRSRRGECFRAAETRHNPERRVGQCPPTSRPPNLRMEPCLETGSSGCDRLLRRAHSAWGGPHSQGAVSCKATRRRGHTSPVGALISTLASRAARTHFCSFKPHGVWPSVTAAPGSHPPRGRGGGRYSLVVLPDIWMMHLDSRLISRELKGRTRTATFTEAPAISAASLVTPGSGWSPGESGDTCGERGT